MLYEQLEHVIFCSAEKGVVFGSPLTEEGIAQVSQLIEYLHKSKCFCLFLPIPRVICLAHPRSLWCRQVGKQSSPSTGPGVRTR